MTGKKILVVDDEGMIVNLCWKVLTGEGYEVVRASSGEEALVTAPSEQPHMVVTDMLMPGIDGLKTFLGIREKQPDLIGVLITGHGTMDTAIEAMELGFSGFIRKPFAPLELIQAVRDAFQKADLTEENARLKTLLPLFRLGERFIFSQSGSEILEALVETVEQEMGVPRVSVMLYDEEEGCLKIGAARGISSEVISKARIKPGEKIAGRVFESGEPVILNGGPEENPKMAAFMKAREIVAAISFPLKTRDRTLGVLNISKLGDGTPFTKSEVEMLSVICRQAVMALENLKVMDEKAEKIRMRTLLEQYVAPEVAEILVSQGQDLMQVGEIRKITVLFADIRNFTPLVQHLPLEVTRSFLNDFFDLFSDLIFQFRGTLDKFMGDAVLAFFGAPIQLDEPENAAVHSAILMHKVFGELKETWMTKDRAISRIGLGIGISSDEMFLGNVGSQKRLDYTVIGVDVNVAQRLGSEAVSGEILITEGVKNRLGRRFSIAEGSTRPLKGLEEPIPVFSINGFKS